MTNWFEDWFDSPLYEKLYANRDEAEAERLIDMLEEHLPHHQCSKILDLGCGRGRHSINLNKRGYRVKGIDLSEKAINKARERAEKMDLDNIQFEVRDMRNPLPETFDAIVNLFTTFGYFSSDHENALVFDSVIKMLKPGGVFVLDYLNEIKVRRSYQPKETGKFKDIDFKIVRYIQDGVIHKDIEFSGPRVDGLKTYSERVKLYSLEWFKREMGKRNLDIEHIYGDYRGSEFIPQKSPRLLIISRWES